MYWKKERTSIISFFRWFLLVKFPAVIAFLLFPLKDKTMDLVCAFTMRNYLHQPFDVSSCCFFCKWTYSRDWNLTPCTWSRHIRCVSETVCISSNCNIFCLYCVSSFVLSFKTGRSRKNIFSLFCWHWVSRNYLDINQVQYLKLYFS